MRLLLLLVALALVGCKAHRGTDLSGRWQITEAMGEPTEGAEEEPYIEFGADGRVNGCASVNLFFGSYGLSGKQIALQNIGMTRRMGASMDVERRISEALAEAKTIDIAAGEARIFDAQGRCIMTLRK